jgi:anti-sigma factor RsiW
MGEENHHHSQECITMFEQLSAYIDSELDEVTCRDIERHLSQCKACKVCLDTLKRTVALCKHLDEAPVPEDFSNRLKHIIRQLALSSTESKLSPVR